MRHIFLVLLVVLGACNQRHEAARREILAAKEAADAAARAAAESAMAEAQPKSASADAIVVPAGWETRSLDKLGEEPFAGSGVISVPPKTKTQTFATTAGGKASDPMAYLDLPDGVRVMLMRRAPTAPDDGGMVKQLLASTGKLIIDRKTPTWFFFAIERADGIAVQGDFWAVRPGLNCGTEKTLTRAQVDEVLAVCGSLRPE
jgi:hypothetical protein